MKTTKQELENMVKRMDLKLSIYNGLYHIEKPARDTEKAKQGCIEKRLFTGSLKECYIYLNGYIDGLDK